MRQHKTYSHVCSHMLSYAHVCSRMVAYGAEDSEDAEGGTVETVELEHPTAGRSATGRGGMRRYPHVCSRMLTCMLMHAC